MGSTAKNDPPRVACPICGTDAATRNLDGSLALTPAYPFCSERCRLVDLSRWLDENYRIPDKPTDL